MNFKVLSHACLLVSTDTSSVVIDPWLLGSCYWRSWWNFPKAEYEVAELDKVDAVVISHVHWDHWHGPTLRKFFSGKPIFVPDEPGLRSHEDLTAIGFDDVRRVPHGEAVQIGDIKIFLYQFGLLLNDAAVVVEADGVTLLDANDAKVAGLALAGILAKHPKVDFAFRSHSSANPRVCFEVQGDPQFETDDREHYLRSFAAFMDRVKPRYAVPFASNHCHLNDDVLKFNDYICNPLDLRRYVQARKRDQPWALQVMLPGSWWSDKDGFGLTGEQPFNDLQQSLLDYAVSVSSTIDKTRQTENRVRVNDAVLNRFGAMVSYAPIGKAPGGNFVLRLTWPDGRTEAWRYDARYGRRKPAVESGLSPEPGLPVMQMPAAVFRDAVMKNMFHHAGISKRCRFVAASRADLDRVGSVFTTLERHEMGLYPLSRRYLFRMLGAYVRRWRELFVYAQAAWLLKVRRKPIYLVEETILAGR